MAGWRGRVTTKNAPPVIVNKRKPLPVKKPVPKKKPITPVLAKAILPNPGKTRVAPVPNLNKQLEELYLNNYSVLPDNGQAGIKKLVSDYNQGKSSLQKVIALAKQGYGINDPMVRQAALHVQGELDPQLAAIRQSQQAGQLSADRTINQTQQMGENTQADLGILYGILQKQLGQNADTVKANFDQTGQQIGSNYDALKAAITNNYSKAQGDTNAELARLGISQAAPQATEAMSRDQAYLASQTDLGKTQQTSNLATQGAGIYGALQGQVGIAGQTGAQKRANAKVNTDTAITEIRQKLQDMMMEQEAAYNAASGTRRAKISDTLVQLKNTAAEFEREAQNQRFQQELSKAKLGVDIQKVQNDFTLGQGKLAADNWLNQNRLEIDRSKAMVDQTYKSGLLKMSAARLENEIKQQNDPNKQMLAQAQLANIESQITKRETDRQLALEAGPKGSAANPKGQAAAQEMLSNSPQAQELLRSVFRGGYDESGNNTANWSGLQFTGTKADLPRHVNAAVNQAKKRGYPPSTIEAIRTAIQVAYGAL